MNDTLLDLTEAGATAALQRRRFGTADDDLHVNGHAVNVDDPRRINSVEAFAVLHMLLPPWCHRHQELLHDVLQLLHIQCFGAGRPLEVPSPRISIGDFCHVLEQSVIDVHVHTMRHEDVDDHVHLQVPEVKVITCQTPETAIPEDLHEVPWKLRDDIGEGRERLLEVRLRKLHHLAVLHKLVEGEHAEAANVLAHQARLGVRGALRIPELNLLLNHAG